MFPNIEGLLFKSSKVGALWFCCALGFSAAISGSAAGIPEPPLVIYGVVRNTADHNIRLTYGKIDWKFKKVASGRIISVVSQLTNVLDQFSFLVQVPCETVIAGVTVSASALDLTPVPAVFDRSALLIGTNTASFLVPAQALIPLSSTQRGTIERVDVQVNSVCADNDGNGLCDDWELSYFGFVGVDPNGDEDRDGVSNRDEYQAGTNPVDPLSLFRFLNVTALAGGGAQIEWTSTEGRTYSIERSTSLTEGFVPIKAGLVATPPINTFLDNPLKVDGPYFYRVRLQ